MLKKNRGMLFVTSVVTLLPILIGLLLWCELPDRIAIHFDVNNNPNGWCDKGLAVFGLPCIVLALHWICILASEMDAKKGNIHGKMLMLMLWICPITCLACSAITYVYAMGKAVNVGMICMLLIGALLMVLGNYLPKSKPNYVIGVRNRKTLSDPDIWRKTQRVAGFAMTFSGVLILLMAPFLNGWPLALVLVAVIAISILSPYVYVKMCKGGSK